MIRRTFANHEGDEYADVVVELVREIRSMNTYVPGLELIMVNSNDEVIGYAMFSRLHIDRETTLASITALKNILFLLQMLFFIMWTVWKMS